MVAAIPLQSAPLLDLRGITKSFPGVAALQAFSVIPSPLMPFAVALSAGIAAGGYAISRGNVKRGAIDGAAAIARSLLPTQSASSEPGRAIATPGIGEK